MLEKNNGGLITLFYEGSENVDFVLEGKIEGQGVPVKMMTGQNRPLPTVILLTTVASITLGGIFITEFVARKNKNLKFAMGSILLVLVLAIAYWLPKWLYTQSPFGF